MAASIMQQIENAIVAALQAANVAHVDQGNTGEYGADSMPAYNVALVEYDPGFGSRDSDRESLRCTATWGVFCYAAQADGITSSANMDPLLVAAHKQLGDETFGGLAVGTVIRNGKCNWNEKDGANTMEVMLTVEVAFDIARTDPSQNYNA